jgi:Fe2+ transport system protein FeoA
VNLYQAPLAQDLTVTGINDENTAHQLIRLGIGVNDTIQAISRLPGGPTVVYANQMEVALGKPLAEQIEVHPCV